MRALGDGFTEDTALLLLPLLLLRLRAATAAVPSFVPPASPKSGVLLSTVAFGDGDPVIFRSADVKASAAAAGLRLGDDDDDEAEDNLRVGGCMPGDSRWPG